MKLSALLDTRLIKCGLEAQDKDSALTELVKLLIGYDATISEQGILSALADREKLGPFSLGKGIGFPHARTDSVKDLLIVMGTSQNGIDFRSPDGQKAKVIILFIIPKKHSNLYLHAFAAFLNFFSLEVNLLKVASAKTPAEVIGYIESSGTRFKDTTVVKDIMERTLATLNIRNTVKDAIDLLNSSKLDTLPVVDDEGILQGEITSQQIIQLGVREHMLSLTNATLLASSEPFDNFLKVHGETGIEGLLSRTVINASKTFQEDEPILEVAIKMAKDNIKTGYVVKDKKIVGVIHINDVLKKITGYKSTV
ncbi:MAG: hypothetical protein A2W23_06755 [Planctomycetes bacterium RBG_16_43_13]|nr:MAG: hypothetical protein A2W23_06755 [Planctomycetes bacterium RBG_16_43_13]